MNRIVLLLIALLTISGAVAAQEATSEATIEVPVTQTVVLAHVDVTMNIREQATTASKKIGTISGKFEVTASDTADWYNVSHEGISGFVRLTSAQLETIEYYVDCQLTNLGKFADTTGGGLISRNEVPSLFYETPHHDFLWQLAGGKWKPAREGFESYGMGLPEYDGGEISIGGETIEPPIYPCRVAPE